MKKYFFLLLIFLRLAGISFSQEKISDDSLNLKIPSDTNTYCIIETNDGMILKGRVIGQKQKMISFRENNLGLLSIETKNIFFIEQAGNGMYFLFYMKDGGLLHGKILSQNASEIEIETRSTGKKTISVERITEMRKVNEKDFTRRGKYRYTNFNAPRYFFTPSAIPVNKDEGYFHSVDFLVNDFSYGITRNFSITSGGVLPVGLFVMPKYGKKVSDVIYIGAGAIYGQTIFKFRSTNFKMGSLFGLATLGNTNNNLTFGMGYAFSNLNHETISYPKPILMFSGTLRFARRFAFAGENVTIPFRTSFYTAEGKVYSYDYKNCSVYGIRFMKEKISADIGLLHYPQDIFKIFPYIDFAIKF